MDYEWIRVEEDDGLATLVLNRPDKLNALNRGMREEITFAMRELRDSARCIVITGEGRAFCTGQDLGDGVKATDIDLESALRDEYVPMLTEIHECPVPTISAVNGPAAGAGANLALSADVVVATESAYFLQAFARIGLMPDAGGTWLMPRLMGLAKAMGTALFAERISARQADEWGLIWEAVPDGEFEDRWRSRARALASGPTVAYRAIKTAIRGSYGVSLGEQMLVEAGLQGECGQSRDFREGVMAFLEKRDASFEGR